MKPETVVYPSIDGVSMPHKSSPLGKRKTTAHDYDEGDGAAARFKDAITRLAALPKSAADPQKPHKERKKR